jgi:hypothetical protein
MIPWMGPVPKPVVPNMLTSPLGSWCRFQPLDEKSRTLLQDVAARHPCLRLGEVVYVHADHLQHVRLQLWVSGVTFADRDDPP